MSTPFIGQHVDDLVVDFAVAEASCFRAALLTTIDHLML
jgi:hypothetical protein